MGGARSVCVTLHARAQGSHLEVLFVLRLIRVRVRVPLLSSLAVRRLALRRLALVLLSVELVLSKPLSYPYLAALQPLSSALS